MRVISSNVRKKKRFYRKSWDKLIGDYYESLFEK